MRLPIGLLAALCAVVFVITGTGTARSPFLLSMAEDLQTTLAAAANLVALSSVTWGLASLVAGRLSDHHGRQPVLLVGTASLAVSLVAMAAAPTYLLAAAAAAWGGLSGGAVSATVYATVADHTPAEVRGRALGWVMTGQSLSLVLMVPLATLIGAVGGWRGAQLAQAVAATVLVGVIWWVVPRPAARRPSASGAVGSASIRQALTRPVLALLGAGLSERVCYAGMAVFLAAYLQLNYGVGPGELALALALIALGNIAGNLAGSQSADRLPDRPLQTALAAVLSALLALPLFLWQPGIVGTIALGAAYACVTAAGRPALMASLSQVPATARGTVLGLNVTAASIGWLAATALGGWLIDAFGFAGLGVTGLVMGLAGAASALVARGLLTTGGVH